MEEIKNEEILRRKRIRKTLLLKVNDEIKEISDSKPKLLINSKKIEELEKVYNRSNILLIEKGIIYSNYIKEEVRIYPNKKITPIYREKSVKNKVEKTNYKLEVNGPSYEEEVVSPIINFIPKKINLGSKRVTIFEKRYTKNNGSIQKFIENNLNVENAPLKKEDQLNKSFKIEKSNMNKLIDKILAIKNNENMESIIKSNIKKLRKYCYKFRIKKKKKRNKSQEQKANINIISSKNISIKKSDKERKSTPFKIIPRPHPSTKKQKKFSNLNLHRKLKKLKTLNEEDGTNLKIEKEKTKIIKQIKSSEKLNTNKSANSNNNNHYSIKINKNEEEASLNLHDIKKELMRSFIHERPSKYSIHTNSKFCEKSDKNKLKIKKKKSNLKKMIMRNVSAFNPKDIEKIRFSMKKNKKDKLELEDNKNNDNSNNNSPYKSDNKKMNNNIKAIINNSFNQRRSKIKKPNDNSKKKSKKKLIESPNKKIDNISNCNTNNNTNFFTITQSSIEKNSKNSRKKSQNKVY
mgnify:CR=1 FL=1